MEKRLHSASYRSPVRNSNCYCRRVQYKSNRLSFSARHVHQRLVIDLDSKEESSSQISVNNEMLAQ